MNLLGRVAARQVSGTVYQNELNLFFDGHLGHSVRGRFDAVCRQA